MGLADLLAWLQGPPRCYLCLGRCGKGMLCQVCRESLPGPRAACKRCGRRLARPASACGVCLSRPPPYELLCCPMDYRFPVDQLIQALKFNADLVAGSLLARLLLEQLTGREDPLPLAILPIPLHPKRQRSRGFNQSSEIARHLGKALSLPVLEDCLERWRHDPPQSTLGALQRRRNVKGAYRLRRRKGPLPQRIALVDDVVTTGATVDAATRVLKSAGVCQVEVWAVARATGPAGA